MLAAALALALVDRADAAAPALAGHDVVLDWAPDGRATPIAFQGYAYVRETSVVTGKPVPCYDASRKEVWSVPLRTAVKPSAVATLPRGGWLVPAAWAAVVGPVLAAHGLSVERLPRPLDGELEVFRADEATLHADSFEGRQRLDAKGAWRVERRALAAGALSAEFERRLADPAFAGDPKARADFFERRHPSRDEAYRRYPVLRTDAHP